MLARQPVLVVPGKRTIPSVEPWSGIRGRWVVKHTANEWYQRRESVVLGEDGW
jgi:hypothetical protein